MNWGNKLVLVFIVFAALIFTLVYKAVNTKFDLVSKDYYKDELRYQEKIDGIHKANTLSSVAITQNNSTVTLALPKEMNGEIVAGEAWFYCKNLFLNWMIAVNKQLAKKNFPKEPIS